jgi:hypothetical protein
MESFSSRSLLQSQRPFPRNWKFVNRDQVSENRPFEPSCYTEYIIYCQFAHSSITFSSISTVFIHIDIFSFFIPFSSNLPTLYNVEKIVWPTVYAVFSVVSLTLSRQIALDGVLEPRYRERILLRAPDSQLQ